MGGGIGAPGCGVMGRLIHAGGAVIPVGCGVGAGIGMPGMKLSGISSRPPCSDARIRSP
jgi:hypothetical protein